MDPGRRSSMPSPESLQLYHPLTLQSMSNNNSSGHHHNHHHHHPSDYSTGSGRSMHGLPTISRGSHQVGGGAPPSEYNSSSRHHQMGLYPPGQAPQSAGPTPSSHYNMSSDVTLSAPNPFSSHHNNHSSQAQNIYPSYSSRQPAPGGDQQQQQQQPSHYFSDGHSHPGSAPGSGYGTPQ